MDRRAFIGGAAFTLGLAACGGRAGGLAGPPAPDGLLLPVRDYMDAHRAAWGLPGMTLAAVSREGASATATSGFANLETQTPVDGDHLFQIGSISKMFTALAAWSLIAEGKLAPETRLADLLDNVVIQGGEGITLQHLLNHTSGLPADVPIFAEGGLWVGYDPGTNWSYSNTGYDLAGRMMVAASGQSYPDLIQTRVLDPLGMTQTKPAIRTIDRPLYAQGYEPLYFDRALPRPFPVAPAPWIDSDSPAGCIAATSEDMSKFLRFLIDLSAGKGGSVLPDDIAVRFLADPVSGWGPDAAYGNGIARIRVNGRDYLHHTGGMVSFSSSLHVDIEAGVAAYASSNVHYGFGYRPVRVTAYACETQRAAGAGQATPVAPLPFDPVEGPEQFAGTFMAADGDVFEVILKEGDLRLLRAGHDSALQGLMAQRFSTDDPDFAFDGVVIEAVDGKAVRAWVGAKEYLVDPSAGYKPAAPTELLALAGRYVDDDRWGVPVSVYARDGALLLENVAPLELMPEGYWRIAGEEGAERLRFDTVINGVAQVLVYSGIPFVRRDI
ncbi:beta-lactamase family protein [Hyphomonas sp. WL0036]|uniref:serine hydrolase domain-containing protein n=1 Tax=Hyphomonas sediminis TaxID=2866160 RepID=UPI001C809E78|nr:serine hydrolase domain-containing protein [Hyphomonas sediminis]MBY9066165.1 beta-lactamase family protein [Hyphomonas sediminis]